MTNKIKHVKPQWFRSPSLKVLNRLVDVLSINLKIRIDNFLRKTRY